MKRPYTPGDRDADPEQATATATATDADADGGVGVVWCPTCGRGFLRESSARCHHSKVHDLSLVGVPVEEWASYVHANRARIANPAGRTSRERSRAERHPAHHRDPDADRADATGD